MNQSISEPDFSSRQESPANISIREEGTVAS